MKCDFCSSPDVARTYARPDVVLSTQTTRDAGVAHVSRGGWAACQTCSDLIDPGTEAARDALAERAADSLMARNPEIAAAWTRGDAIAYCRQIHDRFFEAAAEE